MKIVKCVRKFKGVVSTLFLLFYSLVAHSQIQVAAPQVAATSWLLMDYESGNVLAASNSDERMDPASLVKIMTSYVVGQALHSQSITAQDPVTINPDAWAAGNPQLRGSSLMFLEPGSQVRVDDLNKGMVVQSGNDACIALADFIAGGQAGFVQMMNDYASKLGLADTQFKTVHGLEAPGQFSTARDLASLSRALIHDVPDEYALYKQREFTYKGIRQYNRNRLLWNTGLEVDGLKTGNAKASGFGLVSSAVVEGRRLIAVVLGATNDRTRFQASEKLLKWGARTFERRVVITPDQVFARKRVWSGNVATVSLNAGDQGAVVVPSGLGDALQATAILNQPVLRAPLAKGQVVGVIDFQRGGESIAQAPLVVMESVEEGGLLRRAWDFLVLKLLQLCGLCVSCA
ncbi:D-alanyl-D-alanine carboxypeptidase (penicillin-binding protein 5/6) [Pseudomonas sp. W3I7]|uniref:serine hydrolase n=1 Tax=Pseudomonas sp. W3I7 TaxID=3042292 RepID=UPI00279507FA|nr:serine hydrolase [Pseudomonas sp. W3I7]MDQ0704707.1 D-alanyl-D-alanine carboxypeptidase (penicillin-binding protein 5/6) [Pseudomonas sp. W3I7]